MTWSVRAILLIAGAVADSLTTAALVVGVASTASYLLLYRAEPTTNAALRRVAVTDVPLAIGLAVALAVALAWDLVGRV